MCVQLIPAVSMVLSAVAGIVTNNFILLHALICVYYMLCVWTDLQLFEITNNTELLTPLAFGFSKDSWKCYVISGPL